MGGGLLRCAHPPRPLRAHKESRKALKVTRHAGHVPDAPSLLVRRHGPRFRRTRAVWWGDRRTSTSNRPRTPLGAPTLPSSDAATRAGSATAPANGASTSTSCGHSLSALAECRRLVGPTVAKAAGLACHHEPQPSSRVGCVPDAPSPADTRQVGPAKRDSLDDQGLQRLQRGPRPQPDPPSSKKPTPTVAGDG